ncbi:MAG: AzlD domain-containing protein [Cohaesibacter sp.]|nr:AzlD domain-containing protein [Cohaesibacter sp.]
MTFSFLDHAWWPYLFIVLAGMVPTQIWRWLGVAFAGNLRDDSEWILLARAVANALVAGVIARLILFPSGALLEVPVWIRLISVALAVSVYYGLGRRLLLGVFSGAGCLMALNGLFTAG